MQGKSRTRRGALRVSVLSGIVALTVVAGGTTPGWAQEVVIIAGGDVEWSRTAKAPAIYYDGEGSPRTVAGLREDGWIRVPYLATPESRAYLESELDLEVEPADSHHLRAVGYDLELVDPIELARYPFGDLRGILSEADIAFANLETPLSDDARWSGAFRTPTSFAEGLAWAGFDVLSLANNHALDAEGEGLFDTMESLRRAGVGTIGAGADLDEARRPFKVEKNGVRVAFLGYSQFTNVGSAGFALPDRSGVAPLDPSLIEEDVRRARDEADFVVISFHWGIENSRDIHPAARELAHRVIDQGADIVLGHHPHVPRAIEVYEGGVIAYSLGNLVFGHNHEYWGDNILVRLVLGLDAIRRVEVLPIAGTGDDLARPYVLTGERARAVLDDLRARSAELGTEIGIEGDMGVIQP